MRRPILNNSMRGGVVHDSFLGSGTTLDNKTGLHAAKYTVPRANELPGVGSGMYEGNATSPHR